jgi:anti-sigma factor RsiW
MNKDLPIQQLDNEREQAHAQASEREMVKYFLGQLSPDQERQIEECYFANEELFDRLQAIKEELIDDYLQGKLSDEMHQLFERNFLASPARRQQVEFARSLMNSIPASASGTDRTPRT